MLEQEVAESEWVFKWHLQCVYMHETEWIELSGKLLAWCAEFKCFEIPEWGQRISSVKLFPVRAKRSYPKMASC